MLTRVPVPEKQLKGRHTSTISTQGDECRKAGRLLQGDMGLQPGWKTRKGPGAGLDLTSRFLLGMSNG